MTTDYPDWQRAFRIVGVDVTIPINIAAAAVTLNVAIASSAITLNVNIAAAAVDLNIIFTDQSVAVFDAAKWFAHQAAAFYVSATANVANNVLGLVLSSTVPAGYNRFILGLTWGPHENMTPNAITADLRRDGITTLSVGSYRGGSVIFDTPIRAVAGVLVTVYLYNMGSGATVLFAASIWGYQEAV